MAMAKNFLCRWFVAALVALCAASAAAEPAGEPVADPDMGQGW